MLTPSLDIKGRHILVTGAAGFVGSALARRLLSCGDDIHVVGLDNLNPYYDVTLKESRLSNIQTTAEAHKKNTWTFIQGDITDAPLLRDIFQTYDISLVVHLAAQAGVRHSITHPDDYIISNIIGFYQILEACRQFDVAHLVYASSSSVYGDNSKIPYQTGDKTDTPVSLYAATKKSNEVMAYAYAKLYGIPTTGLRFFTVYGPWGRPDMAYFSFTEKLLRGESIRIFNHGNCLRDFTYIDDVVEGVLRVVTCPPTAKVGEDGQTTPPYSLYNIGKGHPDSLLDFVDILGKALVDAHVLPKDFDIRGACELVPMQQGDVAVTYADTLGMERDFGYKPATTLSVGLRKFALWYKTYMEKGE